MEKSANVIKRIALIAMLTVIVFVLEEVMTFLPNIQLTVFLLFLYSKKLKFYESSIIVTIHVMLDNFILGSFNIYYTPAMFIGWMPIPVLTNLFFKKIEKPIILAFIASLFAVLYSLVYAVASVIILKVDYIKYLIADLPFASLLVLSSFISTLLLYKPLSNVMDKYIK